MELAVDWAVDRRDSLSCILSRTCTQSMAFLLYFFFFQEKRKTRKAVEQKRLSETKLEAEQEK